MGGVEKKDGGRERLRRRDYHCLYGLFTVFSYELRVGAQHFAPNRTQRIYHKTAFMNHITADGIQGARCCAPTHIERFTFNRTCQTWALRTANKAFTRHKHGVWRVQTRGLRCVAVSLVTLFSIYIIYIHKFIYYIVN